MEYVNLLARGFSHCYHPAHGYKKIVPLELYPTIGHFGVQLKLKKSACFPGVKAGIAYSDENIKASSYSLPTSSSRDTVERGGGINRVSVLASYSPTSGLTEQLLILPKTI